MPSRALSSTCCALLAVLRLLLNDECFNQHHMNITAVCVDCSDNPEKALRKQEVVNLEHLASSEALTKGGTHGYPSHKCCSASVHGVGLWLCTLTR